MTKKLENIGENTDKIFYKKRKNRNKFITIEINNETCKVLGYRKKHLKTIYDEADYLEICPIEKMENINGEINITIKENGYKQKYKCSQFRKWDNYNSFLIKEEWIEIE